MTNEPSTLLRCLVADDEPPARDELVWVLSRIPGVEVVGAAASAAETIQLVQSTTPDAIFLDIHMPGAHGLDLCQTLRQLPHAPAVVLVTAYSQFAVEAFATEAVDYVLKPFAEERIAQAVARIRARRGTPTSTPDALGRILAALEATRQEICRSGARVPVESGGRILLLAPQEILFCRCADKRIIIHDRDDAYPAYGAVSLDRLETQLTPYGFFRAHRTFLVNLQHVRAYSPWKGGRYVLVMDDEARTEITVSRLQAQEFKRRLQVLI